MKQMIFSGSIQKTISRVTRANNLEEHIPLSELFPDSFIKEHTQFSSIEELFENGNFGLNEVDPVNEEDLDGYIFITTDFSSWEEMMHKAAGEYRAKEKGSG